MEHMLEQYPTDYHTVEITVDSEEKAERIGDAVRSFGLMTHIEEVGFEVFDDVAQQWTFEVQEWVLHIATPNWVRQYYSSGGTWGYGPFPE